jgi:uncharacterized cupin superfamily protein
MTTALVLHRAGGAPVSTAFRRAAFGRDDPFARQREIAWDGPDAMAAGRTSFIGELEVAAFPHIETLVVVEGELTLAPAGGPALVLGPGSGAVIGQGTSLRIAATARALFTFCAAACERPTKRGLFALRAEADFKPSTSLPQEALASGTPPVCRADNVFTDDAAAYHAGTWDSTPYHRIVRPHKQNEFMHLVAGSVRFAAPDGSVLSTNTGDSLFVPQGASIGWESSGRVAKFFVTQKAG